MTIYHRPILRSGPRPDGAVPLGGGHLWFTRVACCERGSTSWEIDATELPQDIHQNLTAPRAINGPQLMGVLNTTPDSFSDGGQYRGREAAVSHALRMVEQGADIIDIGGESTRPGADYVDVSEEISRTVPVIEALRARGVTVPISIDTRKAPVAEAALQAGASHLNDVSALTHDPQMADVAAKSGAPICLMHAQGDPATMQKDPQYQDVVLDVYDHLSERITAAEAAGVDRAQIIVDPGIGFGKTQSHNLALLRNLSLFHGLGCPILLGVSRKRFIGTITGTQDAQDRMVGSVTIATDALSQGVQIMRVHDIEAHRQAFAMWHALHGG